MGIFNTLGRKVEEFKQNASNAAEGDADYRCAACDEQLESDHDACPACGEDAVHSTAFDE